MLCKLPEGTTLKVLPLDFYFQLKVSLYLLTGWKGQTGNIWLKVRTYGPSKTRSVGPDLEQNIFPSSRPHPFDRNVTIVIFFEGFPREVTCSLDP